MPINRFIRLPAVMIILMAVSVPPCPAQSRGMHIEDEPVQRPLAIGRQYCLLVAVNRYSDWLPLENPVRDAAALKQVLMHRYRMDEFIELYDEKATKAGIEAVFSRLKDRLERNDSILIYYAGHGYYDAGEDTGFWIPHDAGTDRVARKNWISNSEIRDFMANLDAIHVFLISDSCFSGGILNLVRGLGEWEELGKASPYFNKAYTRVSRQVITSGAFEYVPDRSSFSRALITSLQNNNRLLMDPYMLFNEIRLSVRETTPLIGNLKTAGHEDGASFLLFLQNEADRVDGVPMEISVIYPQNKVPLCFGGGGGMAFPVGDVGAIMNLGNTVDGSFLFKFKSDPVYYMTGISLGGFFSSTNAESEYEYNILAFSCGLAGRAGYTLDVLDIYAECTAGVLIGGVDYRQTYVGINDIPFIKPYCQPGLGVNLHTPFFVNLNLSCGFLMVFYDNNPYMAIVPSVRIEYEN
ncbi:MAG: caspase family protein [Spirochaetales bacterium]|nr:caspase family protein [Spirochaetales bacterium]